MLASGSARQSTNVLCLAAATCRIIPFAVLLLVEKVEEEKEEEDDFILLVLFPLLLLPLILPPLRESRCWSVFERVRDERVDPLDEPPPLIYTLRGVRAQGHPLLPAKKEGGGGRERERNIRG